MQVDKTPGKMEMLPKLSRFKISTESHLYCTVKK